MEDVCRQGAKAVGSHSGAHVLPCAEQPPIPDREPGESDVASVVDHARSVQQDRAEAAYHDRKSIALCRASTQWWPPGPYCVPEEGN